MGGRLREGGAEAEDHLARMAGIDLDEVHLRGGVGTEEARGRLEVTVCVRDEDVDGQGPRPTRHG
jgi:hypothetical protein